MRKKVKAKGTANPAPPASKAVAPTPKEIAEWMLVSGVNYLDRSTTIILAGVMGFDSATSSG